MANIKVLIKFNKEAKYCEIKEGTDTVEVVKTFHKVFNDRSGTILQYKKSGSNTWMNVDQNFRFSNTISELRLLQSKEKRLGLGNLDSSKTIVFCCDVQEKFKPAIKYFDEIVVTGARIVKAAELLNIPLVVSEQYPRGLGKTVAGLMISENCFKVEKTKFSMVIPEVEKYLEGYPLAKSVILFGVEAHVCVQQTVLDLINKGFDVHVIADATSSRSLSDRHLAFERLRRIGAYVTSCEAVLLQLVADKNHEHFKAIQGLIRDLPPDTGLLKSSI